MFEKGSVWSFYICKDQTEPIFQTIAQLKCIATSLRLPCNDFINDGLLLCGGSPEIDARCLDAFVAHEVGKQG